MTIGRSVMLIRKSRGMTQEELAQRAGLSASYINKLENDHRDPRLSTLVKIANGLEVPTHTLVYWTDVELPII